MAARTPISRRRGLRARLVPAVLAAAALSVVGPVSAASATDPVTLGTGYVLDEADVLTDAQEAEAQARLEQLRDDSGLDLWVVYVDEFTNPASALDWTDTVAITNGLGPTQYLLGIAVDSRQMNLSGDLSGPLTDEQIGTISGERIIPALQNDEWLGAVDAAAAGLTTAAAGGTGGEDENLGDTPAFSGLLTAALIVGALVVVVVVVIVLVARRRKKNALAVGGEPEIPLPELQRTASAALVATDDALRTSDQELGFARAQFGDDATVEYAAALATARQKLDQAFTLKQQLEDSAPDTEEQQRAWNQQIIDLCEDANDDLDAKAAEFEELRKLAADAPAALGRARVERDRAAGEIDAAAATLQSLRSTYAPEALATVDDNVEQARSRVAYADEQLSAAQASLDAGDAGEAAAAIRSAEDAVDQALVLEAAIDTLGADLRRGDEQAAALVTALEDDIRVASSLADPDGRIAAAVTETRSRVEAARSELAGSSRRPLHTLQSLQEADRGIDTVVQSVRDAAARAARLGQQIEAALAQAQAQISAAENFIAARRGAIGADARTRLAEASAALGRAQSLRTSDPDAALRDAQRAGDLAGQAIAAARTDVGGFSVPNSGLSGGGGGDSFFGAMLGGLVGDALFDNDRGGSWGGSGSWGGGSSRRSSGFGGFGGFSGSRGGSSRSRSGGGGFSSRRSSGRSGGGRSRRGGGRF